MVYPHSNDLGKEKPKPALSYYNFPIHKTAPTFADVMAQEVAGIKQKMLGESWAGLDDLLKDMYDKPLLEPTKPKVIQPDCPVYSQQAHALRLDLKVDGFGIGVQRIAAQWMVSDQHTYHHKGLPIDQAEQIIDTMLADIKKNLMNQIKEKAK